MDIAVPVGLVLAIISPILSAVWVVATIKAECRALRRDVDRHEGQISELQKLRHLGAV